MAMRIYRDADADLGILQERTIAVIGYGNQGQAQALNLRDSGLTVLVGNQEDEYADQARQDGFAVLTLAEAAGRASVVMLLIPDENMPGPYEAAIAPNLEPGDCLVFASGYNITFQAIQPPEDVDVVLVGPRMIGAGVRELYVSGQGFPTFFGVEQDPTGRAREIALALCKGIGATQVGAVEVTFAQETELDLFSEQCFGPAFGKVLTTAVDLLLEEGYPPEAVLLELYMSGEFAYALSKIATMGTVAQSALHSTTSQYGSMSRGMRFMLPGLQERMLEGLDEIRSGAFAREWAAEQEEGCATLEGLRSMARSLPLHRLEMELRQELGEPTAAGTLMARREAPPPAGPASGASAATVAETAAPPAGGAAGASSPRRLLNSLVARVQGRATPKAGANPVPAAVANLDGDQLQTVLQAFLDLAAEDAGLQAFASDRDLTTHYQLSDPDLEFYVEFRAGTVSGALGAPETAAQVRLTTGAGLLDQMLSGQTNAMRAAMTGKLAFEGDAKLALSVQQIQSDLVRLYSQARADTITASQ